MRNEFSNVYHDFTYEAVLASSLRAQWQLDDVLRSDQELDFSRNFMPESLARTAVLGRLSKEEQRTLNQISANQYIFFFGNVEEFVLPFVLDHARPMLRTDDFRIRALLNFASEEAKHIHLFKRFQAAFARGFPVLCKIVGPSELLTEKMLSHHPLAVGLAVLMIEWMTQAHYLGSIRGDGDLDPLFKSLMKHHWMEEAQHAKLDTLIVDALYEGLSDDEIDRAMDEFFAIIQYLDTCLQNQARFNIASFEAAIGRNIAAREALIAQQLRAARWTYLGSGLVHERFKATLQAMSPRAAACVANMVARLAALRGGQIRVAAPTQAAAA